MFGMIGNKLSFGTVSTKAEPDFQTDALEFIAKNLAVPAFELSKHFNLPETQVSERLGTLVSRGLVKEHAGGALVYSITADGVKELERTVRTGLAAYF